jgi:hypothetical protein
MIRNTLLLFPLLAVLLVYFLQEGITIDSLKIGNFKVEKLYLKLDNKLILRMDKFVIPKSNTKEGIGDIGKALKRIKKILTFFEYIELSEVEFTDDTYSVIYADDTLYIDNSDYEIAGMITPQNGGFIAKIPLIKIKKYNLLLQGNMTYGYQAQKITFQGKYKILHIDGNVSIEMQNKKLSFLIDSEETSRISQVLDMFEIPTKTRIWIDQKVKAKRYKLLSLQGRGSLVGNRFVLDLAQTRAKAKLQDVKILFHPKLKPVTAKSLLVRFQDNRLDFDLEEPYYQQKSMYDSQVALLNLASDKHLKLLLKLQFHCPYDKEIEQILEAYHITIPLRQKKGKIRATVNLDIDLKNSKTKVEGRAFLSKGEISVGGVSLNTEGGEVTFTSNRVALWDVVLYDSWYRGKAEGFVNLDTKRAKFNVDLTHITLGKKETVSLHLKNKKKILVEVDFNKGMRVQLPQYKLTINNLKKGGIKIVNSNIKPLLPYIKGLPLQLKSGKVSLRTSNYKSYYFTGNAQWKQSYLYQKGGPITKIPFKGKFQNNHLSINALDGRIRYQSRQSQVQLKRINIDVKKMITHNKRGIPSVKSFKVKGKNCMMRYGKYVLLTDQFELRVRGKNTTFVATKDGDKVRIEKNGKSLVIHAKKIKDRMLQSLINFGGLQGGRYSLEMLGQIGGEMKGTIEIEGGAIESFKAYNDLIALFNTLPALMTFSDPGFSKKGFVVRDGKIVFRLLPKQVIFDTIYLNGKSATIAGKGTVALESGKLNIDLAVRTAREVGKVLGNLPLVGYILFGKDKSMTTGVKIVGTLDKPKSKTNPVQEVLLYPLELIKRTITSPAHIINK